MHISDEIVGHVSKLTDKCGSILSNAGIVHPKAQHAAPLPGAEVDSSVLAYLWLALEANFNIIVASERCSACIVRLISRFIAPYERTLDAIGGIGMMGDTNFTHVPSRAGIRMLAGIANKTIPDRIIACCHSRSEVGRLFSMSRYGSSFIACIDSGFEGMLPVRSLESERFGVRSRDISLLDCIVFAGWDGNRCSVNALTEYSWLDRWEIARTDRHLKRYKNMGVVKEGALDFGNIGESKLARAYSDIHLTRKDDFVKELSGRSDFIKGLAPSMPCGNWYNTVGMYFDVR
ncbi:MAG: hypothetical protein ACREBH_00470 [Candidatus Micrarchaeaceae archaeon]